MDKDAKKKITLNVEVNGYEFKEPELKSPRKSNFKVANKTSTSTVLTVTLRKDETVEAIIKLLSDNLPPGLNYGLFTRQGTKALYLENDKTVGSYDLKDGETVWLHEGKLNVNIELEDQKVIEFELDPFSTVSETIKKIVKSLSLKGFASDYCLFLTKSKPVKTENNGDQNKEHENENNSSSSTLQKLEETKSILFYNLKPGQNMKFLPKTHTLSHEAQIQALIKGSDAMVNIKHISFGIEKTFKVKIDTKIKDIIGDFLNLDNIAHNANNTTTTVNNDDTSNTDKLNANFEQPENFGLYASPTSEMLPYESLLATHSFTFPVTLILRETNPDFQPCFGVDPLSLQSDIDHKGRSVPVVLLKLFEWIKLLGGFEQEGTFRKAGNDINMRKQQILLNKGTYELLENMTSQDIATLTKRWYMSLPKKIFESLPLNELEATCDLIKLAAVTPEEMYDPLLDDFGEPAKTLYEVFIEQLALLSSKEEVTKMNPKNISLVVSPCLSFTDDPNPLVMLKMTKLSASLVEHSIATMMRRNAKGLDNTSKQLRAVSGLFKSRMITKRGSGSTQGPLEYLKERLMNFTNRRKSSSSTNDLMLKKSPLHNNGSSSGEECDTSSFTSDDENSPSKSSPLHQFRKSLHLFQRKRAHTMDTENNNSPISPANKDNNGFQSSPSMPESPFGTPCPEPAARRSSSRPMSVILHKPDSRAALSATQLTLNGKSTESSKTTDDLDMYVLAQRSKSDEIQTTSFANNIISILDLPIKQENFNAEMPELTNRNSSANSPCNFASSSNSNEHIDSISINFNRKPITALSPPSSIDTNSNSNNSNSSNNSKDNNNNNGNTITFAKDNNTNCNVSRRLFTNNSNNNNVSNNNVSKLGILQRTQTTKNPRFDLNSNLSDEDVNNSLKAKSNETNDSFMFEKKFESGGRNYNISTVKSRRSVNEDQVTEKCSGGVNRASTSPSLTVRQKTPKEVVGGARAAAALRRLQSPEGNTTQQSRVRSLMQLWETPGSEEKLKE